MLINQVRDKQGNLNKEKVFLLVDKFTKDLEDADADLDLKGKSIESANMENSSLMHYYECERIKLYSLGKSLEEIIKKNNKIIYHNLTEKNPRDLSETAKNKYIDGNDEILALSECLIAVKEVHGYYQSIVNAFNSRGFQLQTIVKARIEQLHRDVL